MKRSAILISLIFVFIQAKAAITVDTSSIESPLSLSTETGNIMGTLTVPAANGKLPIVLIIAGSGPTDRNGNNPMMKNESLRLLSQALAKNGIATLRYDKRGIAASTAAGKNETALRFDDYVNDAKQWIDLLKSDPRFSKIIVAGHSEGSLIGMIASLGKADGFISIAGAGRSGGLVIKEQLANQPAMIKDPSYNIIDSLMQGKTVKDINQMLYSLFRPSVQPYMISWFKYNPADEIARLNIPILILQGTKDLQVSINDAKALATAQPTANFATIENMNHVLKTIQGDINENNASYTNPALPINTRLVQLITDFVFGKKE